MKDHEKFKALLNDVGLSREEFAELMDMKFTSATNQLAPAKELPKWARSVLVFHECWEKEKNLLPYLNEIKERLIYRLQQEFPIAHDLVQDIVEDHFNNIDRKLTWKYTPKGESGEEKRKEKD